MINEIIKIDLHIHSAASAYKDDSIVKESTVEKVETLLSKLEENEISLFSITDHNRFDYNLYKTIKNKIKESDYCYVKNNLPGIEFDVCFDDIKPKCHVIAIFDDSDEAKLSVIEEKMFDVKRLEKGEVYSLDSFEKVLKNIGLRTILIVHQRQSLDNVKAGHDSLSSGVDDPYTVISCGYIDVLEYNKPSVEGMVKAALRENNLNIPLITGSDCHDWNSYPHHDNSQITNKYFTKLKCLPTFKGLLLSITSFSTRANRHVNTNSNYIQGFSLNGKRYELCNGLNAIIGDNGSGKTLLLNLLKDNHLSYYDKLIKKNDMKRYKTGDLQEVMISFVEQDSISEKVRDGKLFDGTKEYYEEIKGKDDFATSIKDYFDKVLDYINHNIEVDEGIKKLEKKELVLKSIGDNFYYPNVDDNIVGEEDNNDSARIEVLDTIYSKYRKEIIDNAHYYIDLGVYNDMVDNADKMGRIINILQISLYNKKLRNRVRGIIAKHLGNYKDRVQSEKTAEELEKSHHIEEILEFKRVVVNHARLICTLKQWPEFPDRKDGVSVKRYKGYEFKKTTNYNDTYLEEEFLDYCFNKNYKSIEKLKAIRNRDDLSNALKGSGYQELDKYKEQKIEGFIQKWQAENTYISEVSSSESIGNTPGEISLVYYKFLIREENSSYDVLLIDQPEDDINPGKINEYLLSYLQSIRDKKQVVIVTHNPLLVVNLDVDNLICINKEKDQFSISCGSLESEDNGNMLNLVMENLDGGYDAVQRRLALYEKKHPNN